MFPNGGKIAFIGSKIVLINQFLVGRPAGVFTRKV